MAVTAKPLANPVARTERAAFPPSSSRFDWIFTALSFLFLSGLWVDGWAHFHGEVDGGFFTPWHFLFYSAFGIVALFLAYNQMRNTSQGYAFRRALPRGYWLSLVGAATFGLGGLFDMVWHIVFGIEAGTEALLSPSHIMLAIGMALVFTGPIRSVWARQKSGENIGRGWGTMAPALICATLTLALITFFTSYAHPIMLPLAFENSEAGGEGANDQIFAMNIDGTLETRLSGDKPDTRTAWSAWSPDGTRIAYSEAPLSSADENGAEPAGSLWIMNADGSNRLQITDLPGSESAPAWSPDGQELIFVWRTAETQDLYRMAIPANGTPVTEAPEQLTTGDGQAGAADWSPDGTRIVYPVALSGNQLDLWVMNLESGETAQITTDGSSDSPRWSPDGNRILFDSNVSGSSSIYTVNPDGSDRQVVVDTPNFEAWPSWFDNGSQIIYTQFAENSAKLFAIPAAGLAEGQEPTVLTRNSQYNQFRASVSPDGQRILYSAILNVDSGIPLSKQDVGVSQILLQAGLLAGFVVFLAWRWRLPFGAFALLFAGSAGLLTVMNDAFFFIPGALIAGLLTDVLYAWLKPSPTRRGGFLALAFAAPALYYALYFVGVQVIGMVSGNSGVAWSIHVWAGAIFVSGAIGLILAVMFMAAADSATEAAPKLG